MREQALFTLVRSTLLAELTPDIAVEVMQNPVTVGVNSGPTLYMQTIIPARRIGWLGRKDVPGATPDADMVHTETQWLETTLQISATARRNPADADFLTQPSASDICRIAADILQGDRGLAALAVQRVRPLRITEVRNLYFINDSDQYEANPSFDIVLSHVQIRESATQPAVQFVPNVGRV